jgi:hypothetical protein
MPVSFPPNPTDGQLYTYGGVTWAWSAASGTWVNANTGANFVPFSGGTMTGALALHGVTDGSNAAAGQVGEFLTATSASTNLGGAGTWQNNLFSMALTAGDWDVWGYVQGGPPTSGQILAYSFGLSPDATGNNRGPFVSMDIRGASGGGATGGYSAALFVTLTAIRISLAAAGQAVIAGSFTGQNGLVAPTIFQIFARRAR